MSKEDSGHNRAIWLLGVGNFLVVSVVGAFLSWQTHQVESQLSAVRTAGQYIEIVSRSDAPDYSKSLALGAILREGLLSADHVLEAAYRIEDDTLEKTVVGPLFYQIAASGDRPRLPFGYVGQITGSTSGAKEGVVEISLGGWAVDDEGWSSSRPGGSPRALLHVEIDRALLCSYPLRPGQACTTELLSRPGIQHLFPQFPDSDLSGFSIKLETVVTPGPAHLVVRFIDRQGHARNIYSRCVDLANVTEGAPLRESPFQSGSCISLSPKGP